jgi:hypothetical protein
MRVHIYIMLRYFPNILIWSDLSIRLNKNGNLTSHDNDVIKIDSETKSHEQIRF